MIPGLVVTSLSAISIVLPVLALVVVVMPYVIGAVIAVFRRDAIFVAHRVEVATRGLAVVFVIVSVLGFVAIQPRFFRPAWGGVPKPAQAGDTALREAIAPDVKALIDSLPCAGVVVGVIQPTGNQVFGFGRRSVHSNLPPDGETVFEIGGLTQVFTASLFARMVETQTVRMDETLQSLLPDSVSVPSYGGQQIELQHLAT
jgi:CubicO group peptidase (beta-lactamase class C family)